MKTDLHSIDSEKPAITTEEVLASREKSVAAREDVSHSREATADQRDAVARVREQSAHIRELASASNEKIIQEAEPTKAALENHIAKLRDANEHLVMATVHAQILTEEAQKASAQMDHMAHHDFLTGLPNRILLTEKLKQALALAKRHHMKLAVLFLDLDRFKTINDSLGHAVGDALLQAVAQRLSSSIRLTDTVSRQGGDEFLVLLSEVIDEKPVAMFADKLCTTIAAPYFIAGQELRIGATIGISMYPEDGLDADTLIKNADVAMYHAKHNGRNKFNFYKTEMNARANSRQKIEIDLYRALAQHQFELYYQAQVDLESGNIIGAEALIRWHHPERGLLPPGEFIPIAEECGAIVPIGRWLMHEACRQTKAWLDDGLPMTSIAVNISAIEFEEDDFFSNVHAVLHATHLSPNYLELELTESALMKNIATTMPMLQELKSEGIRIAIDDFGTGYSSLSYLSQFPIDTLKIDQSFVSTIAANGTNNTLVDVIISMGQSLGHRVVAEGIETNEQLAFLRGHRCTEGQGYFLSPPLIAAEFSALLKSGLAKNSVPPTLLH